MFRDKKTLKGALGMTVLAQRFEYKVIAVDATHLKSKSRGVLLVAVCKKGNEMIYLLAFGFANFECTKSWTWFLIQLRGLILQPKLLLLILDWHMGLKVDMKECKKVVVGGVVIVSYVENTIREERVNVGRLTVDNEVLLRKVDNLGAQIINLHVQMEAIDNELNVLYTLVEKLEKKLFDFNIPPSP
ncbi:hypothetical protein Ddye_012843 [Dipteronia dyeriana]|uniref:MULE transposase domain-containing protein n=1 Tax=Dipteronia dyeriana TaxID=168575 RepID=A0AAD9X5B8_9ROSI|nr:hypothetical protein Ddye_012843 [Dipteronia dyeriana]